MRSNLLHLMPRTAVAAATTALLFLMTATTPAPASNSHCRNEQPLYASKRLVIAREMTEASDIYVTCWRRSNKHRVVAKFPAENSPEVAFRTKGEWVVWRYSARGTDRMGSLNARTGRHGPDVAVATSTAPFELSRRDGPVAQDLGDASVLGVWIAANGYYAWPVSGLRPNDEGGQSACAMYVAVGHGHGHGHDARIDVGDGPEALHDIRISGTTLRWINNGAHKHVRLGPRSDRVPPPA
jgi:hypothetical protein